MINSKNNILGISEHLIPVLFDAFIEIKGVSNFCIFPNIPIVKKPRFPVKETDFEIMSIGSCPSKEENVVFGASKPSNKESIYSYFKNEFNIERLRYERLVYSNSYLAPSSTIGNGVFIEPGVSISSQTQIGFGVFIKRNSSIGHHCIIDDFTDINPGVTICGNIRIGKSCVIGAGTVIRDGITIGENTIIGMGSVVTKNIPGDCIAYGNPCKVVKMKT